jgi:hypothetical protein
MTKKILYLSLLTALALPVVALGQGGLHSYGPDISLFGIMDSIVAKSWVVFAVIAVMCFLVAGALFLIAQGDPAKLKTARAAFMWGVVGVVVGIISYSIISLVGNFIGA